MTQIVDNRVFLLGLDKLYRDAMQEHERRELRGCARDVAATLRVAPARVPVEGYYGSDAALTEYFQLIRALQQVSDTRIPEVKALLSYQRLCQVAASPIFGEATQEDRLLPVGRDALFRALYATQPDWSVAALVRAAHEAVLATDDCSLVGLAAWQRDAVVIAALRESVVLYADVLFLGTSTPSIGWDVDPELADRAKRFIALFRALFGTALPAPIPANAFEYWTASNDNDITGRCVRLGADGPVEPRHHYHWAIDYGPVNEPAVRDFWSEEIWTTDRYRNAIALNERPLNV